MPTVKVPVGEHLYVWTNRAQNEPPDSCLISSHGLKYMVNIARSASFEVPRGTRIIFYADENRFLKDPGIQSMLERRYAEAETFEAGEDCPNYELTKFQGYHTGMVGTMLPILKKLHLKLGGISAQEQTGWETYAAIIASMDTLRNDSRVERTTQRQTLNQVTGRIRQLDSQATHYTNLETTLSQAPYEDLLEQAALRWTRIAKQTAIDDGRMLKVSRDALKKELQRLNEILYNPPMDMVTVRYRPFKFAISLKQAVTALRGAGYNYREIHCSFCRGSFADGVAEAFGQDRSMNARLK
ncbi:putative adhesin [Hyalangium rubrum]|uniref:Putative adhesin Stv domain-containing protein n=1 Tax=Hyalangium rubrum TaxID=3103134 RepID=A0ABU5HFP4_9BACT|nr:hypothetical protein [Hyalangium sp. s54d21]MDY7232181.1 hypothetical protein [Hyalangium sp. s54d21]